MNTEINTDPNTDPNFLDAPGRGAVPDPRAHASTAAEAVRALNHATLVTDPRITVGRAGGYTCAQDVDATLVELTQLLRRLPQTLTQAAAWLSAADSLGLVVADDGGTALDLVADCVHLLHTAADRTGSLAATLDSARQYSAMLTMTPTTSTDSTTAGGAR